MRRSVPFLAIPFLAAILLGAGAARAQDLDLSTGGPVEITAQDGIEWRQNDQQVVARGNARAVRGKVTVVADRLIAQYRRKQAPPGAAPAATGAATPASGPLDADAGGNEVYRLEAAGHVFIYSETDRAQADRAIYDMDQAVLVLTGGDLKLSSPGNVLTARDAVEYWSRKRMAVARGDAVVTTDDARRISADTIVAYTVDDAPPSGVPAATPPAKSAPAKSASANAAPSSEALAAGKLQRVEIFGNVQVRTATQLVRGERGVYVTDTGIALLVGNARLTQGRTQVNGAALEVNLQTGIYRLLSAPGARVRGLIMPNEASVAGEPSSRPAPAAAQPVQPGGKSR